MPDPEDPAEAAARLETALERIAAHAGRPAPTPLAPPQPPAAPPDAAIPAADAAFVAARLDALITRLRAALEPAPGAGLAAVATIPVRPRADEV